MKICTFIYMLHTLLVVIMPVTCNFFLSLHISLRAWDKSLHTDTWIEKSTQTNAYSLRICKHHNSYLQASMYITCVIRLHIHHQIRLISKQLLSCLPHTKMKFLLVPKTSPFPYFSNHPPFITSLESFPPEYAARHSFVCIDHSFYHVSFNLPLFLI